MRLTCLISPLAPAKLRATLPMLRTQSAGRPRQTVKTVTLPLVGPAIPRPDRLRERSVSTEPLLWPRRAVCACVWRRIETKRAVTHGQQTLDRRNRRIRGPLGLP